MPITQTYSDTELKQFAFFIKMLDAEAPFDANDLKLLQGLLSDSINLPAAKESRSLKCYEAFAGILKNHDPENQKSAMLLKAAIALALLEQNSSHKKICEKMRELINSSKTPEKIDLRNFWSINISEADIQLFQHIFKALHSVDYLLVSGDSYETIFNVLKVNSQQFQLLITAIETFPNLKNIDFFEIDLGALTLEQLQQLGTTLSHAANITSMQIRSCNMKHWTAAHVKAFFQPNPNLRKLMIGLGSLKESNIQAAYALAEYFENSMLTTLDISSFFSSHVLGGNYDRTNQYKLKFLEKATKGNFSLEEIKLPQEETDIKSSESIRRNNAIHSFLGSFAANIFKHPEQIPALLNQLTKHSETILLKFKSENERTPSAKKYLTDLENIRFDTFERYFLTVNNLAIQPAQKRKTILPLLRLVLEDAKLASQQQLFVDNALGMTTGIDIFIEDPLTASARLLLLKYLFIQIYFENNRSYSPALLASIPPQKNSELDVKSLQALLEKQDDIETTFVEIVSPKESNMQWLHNFTTEQSKMLAASSSADPAPVLKKS